MKKGLRAKFTQYDKLKNVLLGTGESELIEDSPNDYQWGCGRNGTGQNLLGKALMDIRNELNGRNVEIQVEKKLKVSNQKSITSFFAK